MGLDAPAEARIRRLHAEVRRALLLACQGLVDRITAAPLTDQRPTNGSRDGYLLERDIAEQLRRIARAHLDDH